MRLLPESRTVGAELLGRVSVKSGRFLLSEFIVASSQLKGGADIGAENINDALALRVLFFRL
jgi:hypothetical protein